MFGYVQMMVSKQASKICECDPWSMSMRRGSRMNAGADVKQAPSEGAPIATAASFAERVVGVERASGWLRFNARLAHLSRVSLRGGRSTAVSRVGC
jgi:hypothetical protein